MKTTNTASDLSTRNDADDLVTVIPAAPKAPGIKIPAPTAEVMGDEFVAQWHRDMAILGADPRTSGGQARPAALVARVLRDARGGK